MDRELDEVDYRILRRLQGDGRLANAELARELGMAPSAVLERVRKLEQRGVLLGYEGRIAPKAVGMGLTAFVFVRSEERTKVSKVGKALAAIPEVLEVHHVAGDDCYLIKLRARDTEDLSRLLREEISVLPAVRGTRTTIVLETLKETWCMPLDGRFPASTTGGAS